MAFVPMRLCVCEIFWLEGAKAFTNDGPVSNLSSGSNETNLATEWLDHFFFTPSY